MAQITIYGNQVSAPPAYMRWKMVYEITETSTTYSVSLVGIIQAKSTNGTLYHTINAYLDATGKNRASWAENERANNLRFLYSEDWKETTIFSSRTISWNKTRSAQSISITLKSLCTTGLPSTALTKSFTIPAKPTYTITYNANGGTGAPAQQTKWHGENITLQAGIPTRANYTFMGWATSQSGSAAYQPSATYTANADATLYAVWKPFEYAVTYNANGGTGAPAQQTKYYGADLTLSAVIPIRAGYTFLGWATSQSGAAEYQPNGVYTANSPITLYAVWEAYYTYTINTMRVNASGDIIEDPNGEYIYIKANLTTEDYTNNPLTAYHFKDNGATATVGWYKNSDKTDSATFPYQPTANSFILYAWYHADTEKHEVSFQFDTNNTTGKVISVIVPPIFRTMDFLAGGKGVAIGKRATQEGFDVEMNTVFRNEIKCSETNGNIKNIYDVFYPVGSYYETNLPSAIPSGQSTPTSTDLENLGVTWFNPNFAWGGTWERVNMGDKVLFSGDTTGDVTLAETVTNFEYITIFFRDNDHIYDSTNLAGNNLAIALSQSHTDYGTTQVYIKTKTFSVINNTIKQQKNGNNVIRNGQIYVKGGAFYQGDYIYITKVIGRNRINGGWHRTA